MYPGVYIVLRPLILFPHPSRFAFDFLPQIFSNLSFTLMIFFHFPYYFSHFSCFSSLFFILLGFPFHIFLLWLFSPSPHFPSFDFSSPIIASFEIFPPPRGGGILEQYTPLNVSQAYLCGTFLIFWQYLCLRRYIFVILGAYCMLGYSHDQ